MTIDLDASGRVQAIHEPRGASVRYVRQDARLIGHEVSDGRRFRIDWQDGQPVRLTLHPGAKQAVAYGYEQGYLTRVSGAGGESTVKYDGKGQLASLVTANSELAVTRNPSDPLMSIRTGECSFAVEFVAAAKTLLVSGGSRQQAVHWQFGPKNRAVGFGTGERTVWWVWGVDGRVIQMAQGVAQNNAEQGGTIRVTGTIGVE